jgi:hypothetical protein
VPLIVNFVVFQVAWFLSLKGAAIGYPWLGVVAVLAFLALEMFFGKDPWADARIAAFAALGGVLFDTLFVQFGLLRYASPEPFTWAAPYWILAMWANFGLTLNSSLGWLQGRPVLAAVLGAVGGPLAYLAGVRIGAATLIAPGPVAYGAIGLVWGIATPVLLWLARPQPDEKKRSS